MKKLFIETKKIVKEINLKELDKLKGKTISLAATIQYLDLIPKIKSYLESKNKKVVIKKGAYHKAHVLGCNPQAFDKNADTLLLLADGKFHALNNAIILEKEISVFNTKKLEKLSKEEIEKQLKKIKGKKAKFLSAEKIGILISTKPGQAFKQIKTLKEKIQKLNKKVYLFTSNEISLNEFENFPQIEIFVNTACPGLVLDSPNIINYSQIQEFLN